MKKIIVGLLFIVFVLSSCGNVNKVTINSDVSETTSTTSALNMNDIIPEYDRLKQSGTQFENAIIFSDDVKWLRLSFMACEEEQEMIREYQKEDFDGIKTISPDTVVTIAVQKVDINNDGSDEIIAFLGGTTYWGGASSTGAFRVYFLNNDKIVKCIPLPGFNIDTNCLENSHQIGVIMRKEGAMDFLILNRLFVWNGNGWG